MQCAFAACLFAVCLRQTQIRQASRAIAAGNTRGLRGYVLACAASIRRAFFLICVDIRGLIGFRKYCECVLTPAGKTSFKRIKNDDCVISNAGRYRRDGFGSAQNRNPNRAFGRISHCRLSSNRSLAIPFRLSLHIKAVPKHCPCFRHRNS